MLLFHVIFYLLPEDFLNYTRFTFAPVWNMINQLVIQIIIEDKNLPSKMHGSFLVKLLRFCISSTEEAKMKKKTIYVVIAIAVVAILAIGFQTAPKTPAFDFESNPIVDVVQHTQQIPPIHITEPFGGQIRRKSMNYNPD